MANSTFSRILCALAVGLPCANSTPTPCTKVQLYKLESSDWCEQFCVDAKVVKQIKQFGDVNDGTCKDNGFAHYDHTEDTHSVLFGKVELYKKGSMQSALVNVSDVRKDCLAFKPAKQLNATVVWDQRSSLCRFSCAASQSLSCMVSPDGIDAALRKSNLGPERSACSKTIKPSEDEPLLVTVTCPEWKMVVDMHGQDKMGAMTVELDMFKDIAVDVMRKALGQQNDAIVV